jgi:hypothetical protein
MSVIRIEKIKFSGELNWPEDKELQTAIEVFMPDYHVKDGDKVSIDFTLYIDYLNNIEDRLLAMEKILKAPGVVSDIDYEELRYGQSVIANIFDTITRIQLNGETQ